MYTVYFMLIYENPPTPAIANLLSLMRCILYFCSMQSNQQLLVDHLLEQLNLDNLAVPPQTYLKLISQQNNLVKIDDIIAYINALGMELQQTDAINELVEKIEDDTNILIHKLKFITAADRPKVWTLNQIQPVEVNHTAFLNESIQIAGGIPVTTAHEADKIILINSDETAFAAIPDLLNIPGVAASKAVELDQVFVITKPHFAQVPGYDYLTELEALAEILQPKYFVYGHEGKHWLQFQLK